ncbi:hypothetical protein ACROYT_G015544 [Oculina patagonica]
MLSFYSQFESNLEDAIDDPDPRHSVDIRQFVTNYSAASTPVNTAALSTPVNAATDSIPVNSATCNVVANTATSNTPPTMATSSVSAFNNSRVLPQFVRDQLATLFPETSPANSDVAEAIDLLLSSGRRAVRRNDSCDDLPLATFRMEPRPALAGQIQSHRRETSSPGLIRAYVRTYVRGDNQNFSTSACVHAYCDVMDEAEEEDLKLQEAIFRSACEDLPISKGKS